MKEIVKRISEILPKLEEDKILLDNSELQDIKKENIKPIPNITTDKTIAFIDGGNAELFLAPNFCVSLIRTAAVIKNNHKSDSKKLDFYCLVYAHSKENEIFYKVETFPKIEQITNLEFKSTDSTLTIGNNRASISIIPGIIRRFAELQFASNIDAEIIVLDGSLKTAVTYENIFMNSLINSNKTITAFSKTTTLLTLSGNSIIAHLNSLSKELNMPWSIFAANIKDKNYNANIFFTKLNNASNHIFKLEIYNNLENIDEILSILATNAKDFSFPGYPFALVQVDELARISNNEKEYLKTLFESKAGTEWKTIFKHASALDAHSVLDSLNY